MKITCIAFLVALYFSGFGQQIEIPKGVVYKYADSVTNEKAKAILAKELSDAPEYSLNKGMLFIGPVLWARYKEAASLKAIKGGNITIKGYKDAVSSGKLTQNKEDFKLVWDHFREEVKSSNFKLRKATVEELKYYWSVISFDIEEPLIIVETAGHNYILNISPKDFMLVWFDEAPKPRVK